MDSHAFPGLKSSFALRLGYFLLLLAGIPGCSSFHGRGIRYQLDHEYSVHDRQFLRSMGHLIGPAILANNRVGALINGDQIFPAMLESIRSARQSIDLETYIYWSGDVGQKFAEALAERARARVKVHVLIDWVGSRKVNSRDLQIMREAGVEVEKYNPIV